MSELFTARVAGRPLTDLTDEELATLRTQTAHGLTMAEGDSLAAEAARRQRAAPLRNVVIIGMRIPMGDLAAFYLKSVFAAIPAALVVVGILWLAGLALRAGR